MGGRVATEAVLQAEIGGGCADYATGSVTTTGGSQSTGAGLGFGWGSTTGGCGGGGGGFFGGNGREGCSGGGGSGYVLTALANKPAGYKLGSEYYLSNAQTIAGNQSFAAPGGGKETGHSGNGYARITFVE